MNDFMDVFLGGVMAAWSLMLIAGIVIAVVFLLRLRRESVLNNRRRRANAAAIRERRASVPTDQETHR
jgi:hypothetical protein